MYVLLLVVIALGAFLLVRFRERDERPAAADVPPPDADVPPEAVRLPMPEEALRPVEDALPERLSEEPLSIVALLGNDPRLSTDAIVDELRRRAPDADVTTAVATDGPRSTIHFGELTVDLELVRRLDDDALEQACRQSADWPEARSRLARHCCAVVLRARVSSPPPDVLPRLRDAARLLNVFRAFAATCPEVLGAWWPTANKVIAPARLKRLEKDDGSGLPYDCWVSVTTFRDEAGDVIGYTQGLEALDAVDFETRGAPESPEALAGRLQGLTVYSIESCSKLMNGDTTGVDAAERIRLDRKPSETVNKGWVFHLTYLRQSAQDPWD